MEYVLSSRGNFRKHSPADSIFDTFIRVKLLSVSVVSGKKQTFCNEERETPTSGEIFFGIFIFETCDTDMSYIFLLTLPARFNSSAFLSDTATFRHLSTKETFFFKDLSAL